MNATDYFLNPFNWSYVGLLFVVFFIVCHNLLWKTATVQKLLFGIAMLIIYVVLGSPLADLDNFGLHSVNMLQQIVLLMVAPILILKSMPSEALNHRIFNRFSLIGNPKHYAVITWLIGVSVMWMGHFISAAMLSTKYGIPICGIQVSKNSFFVHLPETLIYSILFIAGFILALPVFHPNKQKRLQPLKSVMYLFTTCVSCAILGLYVVFMASSAGFGEGIPMFVNYRSPILLSVKTDQELAGLMMWVPGCILYALSSVKIMLNWYDATPIKKEKQLIK